MQLLHAAPGISAVFDDRNLIAHGGLAPLTAFAQRLGLPRLLARRLRPSGPAAANAAAKAGSLIAGMAAGADSIDDMGLLRHGAMGAVFGGIRAPSTLGTFLRNLTWGNVRQLDAVHRELTAELARAAPLLPGGDAAAFIDIDSTHKRVYGYAKQGAKYGHAKVASKPVLVKGLNALISAVSTPLSAPVLGPVRLRGGNAASTRGAASLIAEAAAAAREAGCTGMLIMRFDSGFYNSRVARAAIRNGAHFSVTVQMNEHVRAAIAAIPEDAWTPIRYPRAIWDEQAGGWISDAEVAETSYTAFTSKSKDEHVTARLIVRRVRRKNEQENAGQGELFPSWRHHGIFTNSPLAMLEAEENHRDHAVIEQVNADLYAGPLAHLPSGSFNANAAWLTLAAITFNLLRAAGTLAGPRLAKARTATIRRNLITVPARTARSGRGKLAFHLPERWHREHEWTAFATAAWGPPPAAP